MARSSLSLWALAALAPAAAGQRASERLGCTAVAIDGAATVDGSAYAGMNTDAANADFRLAHVPARRHTEKMRDVFTFNGSYPRWTGYGRGDFFHPLHPDAPLSVPVGAIPQVPETFGYYESTEPLINDQGLGFGESSCAAMLVNRFPGDRNDTRDVPVGLIDTMTLMQLALERCATARCAVELMGALSEAHGFVPTPGEPSLGAVRGRVAWDDAGEAFTLADRTGEAWVFHVVGGVTGVTKSVWAAMRVPRGHVAVVANDFIIAELPDEPTADILFNRDIFRAARAADLWDGRGALHFSRTFAPDGMAFSAPAGNTPIPLYASLRRWALYSLAAPELKLRMQPDNQEFPVTVKVERPLGHRDVMHFLRYQYEGTEFDMTKGMLAGPFGSPFRDEAGPKTGQVPRGIAIQRTLYSIIVQTGPARSMGWFSMDTPTTSVYVPLLSRATAVSKPYSIGHMAEFSRDNAWWAFNLVSTLGTLNYRDASQQDIYPAIEAWQDRIDRELTRAEGLDHEALNQWTVAIQEQIHESWWKLSDHMIMKFNDGRVNVPKVGSGPGYPQWYADMIGFGNDIHPIWVQAAALPTEAVAAEIEGYVAPSAALPQVWHQPTATWSYTPPRSGTGAPSAAAAVPTPAAQALALQCVLTLLALVVGAGLGASWERRRSVKSAGGEAYAPLL